MNESIRHSDEHVKLSPSIKTIVHLHQEVSDHYGTGGIFVVNTKQCNVVRREVQVLRSSNEYVLLGCYFFFFFYNKDYIIVLFTCWKDP